MQTITIDGRPVGPGHRAFLIAEIAQAHDGSLGQAHAYIDAAAQAGADAIKFQIHIAAAESTLDEPFRVAMSGQDETRFAYWRRMEFTEDQWAALAAHARDKHLVFLNSAFSRAAIEVLKRIGMPAWKIASGEIASLDLLKAAGLTGAPVLLSTGLSGWREIDAAVACLRELGAPLAVFQTTSKYPTAFADTGLNVLADIRARYDCPTGLSDHSGSIYPGLAALAQGADLLEVHLTFHKGMFGPDVSASLTIDQIRLLADARDAFFEMAANPVDKESIAAELADMRGLFSKSVAPARDLPEGISLTADMLMGKKPGTGIPLADLEQLIGRRLKRAVSADRLLTWEDINE